MKSSSLLVPAIFAALGLAVLGAGNWGAAQAMSSKPGGATPNTRDRFACFDADRISNFQVERGNKIIIVSDDNEAYELSMGGICSGLDSSFSIGVRSRHGTSQVCGPMDADIVYHDPSGFRDMQECPVTAVRHLTGEAGDPYVIKRSKRAD